MPNEINTQAVYSIEEVEQIFGSDWQTIQTNLNMKRVFRNRVTGVEIMLCLQRAALEKNGFYTTESIEPVKPKRKQKPKQVSAKSKRALQPLTLSDID